MELTDEEWTGPARVHVPKRRQCLRCDTQFESSWAGERICGACKQSSAWRAGEPLGTVSRGARGSSK